MFRRLLLAVLIFAAPAARAAPEDAPFETRLFRLSEILGSLHYLRNLCGETSNQWREQMELILAEEKPEPEKRARYIASFNRGYRSFSGVYAQCTDSAAEAIARYMKEGEELSHEIVVRFGN